MSMVLGWKKQINFRITSTVTFVQTGLVMSRLKNELEKEFSLRID